MDAATFPSRKKPPPPQPPHSKPAGGGGVFATSYDDVFGGPPKFAAASTLAPRAEDYSEIFRGFRTSSSSSSSSSIPVLDLPAVNSVECGSVFDYSDVFGGLNDVEFAVPFDELFRSSDGFDASDDEAWTPVGTESLSDDSDPFAFSDKSQCFLNGNIHLPSVSKHFNVSYDEANPGTSSCIPNNMCVTQFNDVSPYTCIVDEDSSLREMGNERFCSPLVDDIVLNVEVPPVVSEKHTRKTTSDISVEGPGSKSFDGDRRSGRTRSASISIANTTSASDINSAEKPIQMAPPSGQPPLGRNGNSCGVTSHPKVHPSCGFEATVDQSLPPFLDMEVDSSSSAAVSAAAMKNAMEKAQAKLKAAKEFRGRKDSFQNGGKMGPQTDVNGVEDVTVASNECFVEENQLHATSDRGVKMTKSSKVRHGRNLSQILPVISAAELPTGVTKQSGELKHDMKCKLSMDTAVPEVAGEWKEARQYYEFVNSDNPKLAKQPPSKDDRKAAIPKGQDKNDDNSDSAEEAYAPEENRRRLKTTKSVSRQEYYEKMFKVAQEVHDTSVAGHSETGIGLKGVPQVNQNEQKPKSPDVDVAQEVHDTVVSGLSETNIGQKVMSHVNRNEQNPESFEVDAELEKCWEYLEDLEQEKVRGNLAQSPEPTFDIEHSANTQKQHENSEQLEKAAGPEQVGTKLMEAEKHEQRGNTIKKTGEGENQNGACRSQTKSEWEDEDWEPDSSFDESHQNSCNGHGSRLNDEFDAELDEISFELRTILEKVDRPLEVSSPRENGDTATVMSNGSKLVIETTHVRIDERESNARDQDVRTSAHAAHEMAKSKADVSVEVSTLEEIGDVGTATSDESDLEAEVERTEAHAHEMPKANADVFVEVSAPEENGDIGTASSDESELEAAETTNGVADEAGRSEFHTSRTLNTSAENSKSNGISTGNDRTSTEKDTKIEQSDSDSMVGEDPISELGKIRSQGCGQVLCNEETNARSTKPERNTGWNEPASTKEASHAAVPDIKENHRENKQLPHLGQNIGRIRRNNNLDCSLEAKGDEKKKDIEKDHIRKLEEERERERERVKDRMAVEVAIREARERAFSDARDRAERVALERATDEARQRAMADARERLEKACAEARERSLPDKSSEARLRAERAAVERATAEARQRAIEKAMAERATFEARERMQRSVSEKFTSERDVMMRQSSFPSTSDRYEAGDGEPAQRCKARLERHQRTVERVAKALAEKNTRDLQAQREQAVRDRFAETLDADIKRWSSGKAGNLRALLSTLQYILGPDSGWQPIPLTEVITAAAVKKAYRKATLCVHPDKLQQRGATIQQKYICEKVFDLLKEAWNRFNSEEK